MASSPADLARALVDISLEAARAILEIYDSDFDVRTKDDRSPVTDADEKAEAIIVERLKTIAPDIPIVAEEAVNAGHIPEVGERFFLVDPLDGTKEFINRNGEFTVNIGLIEQGVPVAGVVYAPAKNRLFWSEGEGRAFEASHDAHDGTVFNGTANPIRVNDNADDGYVVIASRSHRDSKTDELLNHYKVKDMIAAGSSLKFCLVATGEADLYPRHGRTMEWDTAAGQAVLLAAGGSVTDLHGKPLLYGKKEFENPFFIARGPK